MCIVHFSYSRHICFYLSDSTASEWYLGATPEVTLCYCPAIFFTRLASTPIVWLAIIFFMTFPLRHHPRFYNGVLLMRTSNDLLVCQCGSILYHPLLFSQQIPWVSLSDFTMMDGQTINSSSSSQILPLKWYHCVHSTKLHWVSDYSLLPWFLSRLA